MLKIYADFLESVKAQISSEYSSYERFMVEETYINGKAFSFKDHEYQEYCTRLVENNPGKYFYITKCSQIGISEWAYRLFLARAKVRPGSATVISFPSRSMSMEMFKTRVSPIIDDSPALRSLINRNTDSASVKGFYNGSMLYALGGNRTHSSATTLSSRPLSGCLCDEYDKQDINIITGYLSRMTHTKEEDRLVVSVSTPTVADMGIDAAIKDCRVVHTAMIHHLTCGHKFVGDFFEDIVLPGYNKNLRNIANSDAINIDISLAYLRCPSCGEEIEVDDRDTYWDVSINPEGNADNIGVVLDPFCAKAFVKPKDLIKAKLRYTDNVEFMNQSLGRTAHKSESSIDITKIHFVNIDDPPGQHIFGLDMGKNCHYMRGILRPDTTVHVAEMRVIPLSQIEEFIANENKQHIFAAAIMDSQPYSDLVYRMVKQYPRLFSAIYSSPVPPMPELYKLRNVDKHQEVVRQININKPLAMDGFIGALHDFYTFQVGPYDEIMKKHFSDMRRVRDYRFEEMLFKMEKSSKGEDHFFHTAIYLFMAAKLAQADVATLGMVGAVLKIMNPARRRAQNSRR